MVIALPRKGACSDFREPGPGLAGNLIRVQELA